MSQKKKRDRRSRSEREVLEVFNNTPNDLDLNAMGYLSRGQRKMIVREIEAPFIFMTIFWVFALVFYAISSIYHNNLTPHIVIAISLGLPFARQWFIGYQALREDKVAFIEGPLEMEAKLVWAVKGSYPHPRDFYRYRIRIGSQKFWVPKTIPQALEFGAIYRLYYTPRGRFLVAAELMAVPEKRRIIQSKAVP